MLWDASQAHGAYIISVLGRCWRMDDIDAHFFICGPANNRFDLAIKHALVVAGSSGFTYPICTAPAYVSGKIYTAGVVVSYGGYIWEVRFLGTCFTRVED